MSATLTPAETMRRAQAKAKREELELTLASQLRATRVTGWEREYCFHPVRRWRFDFAWPEQRLAVEVDGGTWSAGRHSRGQGYEEDCRKLAEATLLGWRVLRVTGGMVHSGEAAAYVQGALGGTGAPAIGSGV